MKRKFWFGSIGLVALLSVALIISWQFSHRLLGSANNPSNDQSAISQSAPDLSLATSVSPMLAQVRPAVKLPQDSEFIVSGGSATATIRFIEGSIKPLDVHVGNTQNFRIVVISPNGIKRVVAEIETDNGINKVELTREGLVGVMDTYPNPYTVNPQDNTLKILDQDQLVQARLNEHQRELAQQKTNQANAAAGQREVWTGSWVVKDVHDKTYFTNFIAYDSAGNQEKLTMTWSDLCNIPLGGNWHLSQYTASNTCAVISTVDGVDNGDIYIDGGKTLNLQAAGNFFWTPGKNVFFQTGQLILAANKASQLSQGYLYVRDADNDWHSAPTALSIQTSTNSTTTPAGYRRRSILISTNDCNDDNAQVVPGNTIYRSTPFANEITTTPAVFNYDWDCDGSVVVNPNFNQACDSPTTINKYNFKSCTGFDIGGCCGSGGSGGDCSGPECTQARGYNFWSVKSANADDVGCCDGLQPLYGCSVSALVTISNSSCGQNRNIAWRTSYSNNVGCSGTTYDFYKYNYGGVGCK